MTRGDRPAERRASDDAADPLEEALRQVGADILDEPVPERLRQVLRRAHEGSEADPEPAAGEPTEGR
jgi:hypothetical protein